MGNNRAVRRKGFFDRFSALAEKHSRVLIVGADNVGSRQIAELRFALRGKATILFGKNTMIRTVLKRLVEKIPQLDALAQEINLNIGLVFCEADTSEVRKIILSNKVPAAARQGLIAPIDVIVPAGPTGLDPSQTSYFQALSVSTKIVKGQIEIQSPVHVIRANDRVTASQSSLLQKLNIRPFTYGLKTFKVYDDGSVYDAAVLDMSDDDILCKFHEGVKNIAAFSLEAAVPTQASIIHSVIGAFKNAAALCIEGDYVFPQMENMKKMIENPGAFAAPAAGPAAAAAPAAEAKKKEPEPESESDGDMGLDLFD